MVDVQMLIIMYLLFIVCYDIRCTCTMLQCILQGDLVQEAEWSTLAEIKATDLLHYITAAKFDDSKGRGTSKDFIIHWCEQLRLYRTLCEGNTNHFSKPVKPQMLQNTLDCIPEF